MADQNVIVVANDEESAGPSNAPQDVPPPAAQDEGLNKKKKGSAPKKDTRKKKNNKENNSKKRKIAVSSSDDSSDNDSNGSDDTVLFFRRTLDTTLARNEELENKLKFYEEAAGQAASAIDNVRRERDMLKEKANEHDAPNLADLLNTLRRESNVDRGQQETFQVPQPGVHHQQVS